MDFTEISPWIQEMIIQAFEEEHPGVEYDDSIPGHLSWCQDKICEEGISEYHIDYSDMER